MSNVKGRTFLRYQMRRAAYSKLLTPITAVYQGKRRDDKAGGHISNTAFWDQKLSGEWSSYIERSGSRLTLARMIASLTSSALPDATSAIDIGCGSGVLATALLERGFDRYVGVDISDVAVQSATEYMNANRELFPATCHFTTGGMVSYSPPSSERYSCVIYSEVLYLLPSVASAVEEVRRGSQWLHEDGAVALSLKDDGKSHAIIKALHKSFDFVQSALVQHQAAGQPSYSIKISAEMPAYLIAVIKPR